MPKQPIHKQQTAALAAAITKHRRLGGWDYRLLLPTSLDAGKSQTEAPADSVLGEGPLRALQRATCSLGAHAASPWCAHGERMSRLLIRARIASQGSHPCDQPKPNYLPRTHFRRALEVATWEFGGAHAHIQPATVSCPLAPKANTHPPRDCVLYKHSLLLAFLVSLREHNSGGAVSPSQKNNIELSFSKLVTTTNTHSVLGL